MSRKKKQTLHQPVIVMSPMISKIVIFLALFKLFRLKSYTSSPAGYREFPTLFQTVQA